MKMPRLIFLLPVALVALLAIAFTMLLSTDRNRDIIPSALLSRPAPTTELPSLVGLEGIAGISSPDFVGDVTVVNFFASWCVPCLAEHPAITELTRRGYRVWGINYRDPEPDGLDWLARHGNPYAKVGTDQEARAGLDWGVTGVPETFIIDRQGIIRHKHSGPITPQILAQEIVPILQELADEGGEP